MTSRSALLVAASLCAALAPIRPASAQTEMSLRASYQGQFLPAGTEIIVLSREGREKRDGRYQPEFFSTREFPRTSRSAVRRDRLGSTGRSNRSYRGTQDSGRLYFIYALAPDSTLYWSYSAQRDSLKYDVVSTGVMSVAPVPSSEIRDDILRSFFQSRITVVLRGDKTGEPRSDPTGDAKRSEVESEDEGADLNDYALIDAAPDSASLVADDAPAQADIEVATQDTVASLMNVPPVASAPGRPLSSSMTLPPILVWSLLLLLLAGIAVPAYLAHTYRMELKRIRREMFRLRDQMASSDAKAERDAGLPYDEQCAAPHGDTTSSHDVANLRAAIEDANLRYEELEEDYEILRARYVALEKELETQKV